MSHHIRRKGAPSSLDESSRLQPVRMENGQLELKDQLRDYQFRGIDLSSLNLLDFILSTYEGKINDEQPGLDENENRESTLGRPPNPRSTYLDSANKGNKCRITRTAGHEILPRVAGAWFPRNDRESDRDMHMACMLAILKPWRELSDLKGVNETFDESYNRMLSSLDQKHTNFIKNAQYFYECVDDARDDNGTANYTASNQVPYDATNTSMVTADNSTAKFWTTIPEHEITDDLIDFTRKHRKQAREILFGEAALDEGFSCGFFDENPCIDIDDQPARTAGMEDIQNIGRWEKELQAVTKRMMEETGTLQIEKMGGIEESIHHTFNKHTSSASTSKAPAADNGKILRPILGMLNKGQKKAHDIIEERLKQHIEGTVPRPVFVAHNFSPHTYTRFQGKRNNFEC